MMNSCRAGLKRRQVLKITSRKRFYFAAYTYVLAAECRAKQFCGAYDGVDTLIINLSNDAKSNMNVAGRLKVPAFVNLQADYSRILDEQYSYELTMEFQF